MAASLTEEQRAAIEAAGGEPIVLVDPESGERYLLLEAELFEKIRDERGREAAARQNVQSLGEAHRDEPWPSTSLAPTKK